MGTIIARKRKNGSTGYTAQIVIKKNGKRIHGEAKTFEREQAAITWMGRRERELSAPGGLDKEPGDDATLSMAIDRFTKESVKEIGGTKAGILREVKKHAIADKKCAHITSADIVGFATSIGETRSPATVTSYLVHLGAVFAVARPAWGFPLDQQAMRDAMEATKRLGISAQSISRERRPALEEIDQMMSLFQQKYERRKWSAPMHIIVAFAIFSARRQDEITRLRWADFDEAGKRILVRDMKDPAKKIGNNVWCDLPEQALAIIKALPRSGELIFPYSRGAICQAFIKARDKLKIDDLHFHDLRHEGVSRLFEMGLNIPHAAAVSGHRSWSSLKRYSHIRQAGDKYAGWKWLPIVTGNQ